MELFGWMAKAGKQRDKSEFLDKIRQNLSLNTKALLFSVYLKFTSVLKRQTKLNYSELNMLWDIKKIRNLVERNKLNNSTIRKFIMS